MSNSRFAEDPDPRTDSAKIAVRDILRTRGWFARVIVDQRPWPPEDLRIAVERAFCDFFAAWYRNSRAVEVDWDAIAAPLKAAYEPYPIVRDPRQDVRDLFCRVAGIGASGRSFDKAATEAGLSQELRSDAELRDLATSIRALDREHLAARELPGKAGLLFERIPRWPFVADAEEVDWKGPEFRQDLKRYCDLTNLNLSEIGDDVPPPQSDRSLGQPQNLGTWCKALGLQVASDWFAGRMRRSPRTSVRDEVLCAARKLQGALGSWMLLEGVEAGCFPAAGSEFQEEAARVFLALVEHTIDVPAESLPTYAWYRFQSDSSACLRMWFARAAFDGRSERMPADVATKWLRVVKQEMSSFRSQFGRDGDLWEGWRDRVWQLHLLRNPQEQGLPEDDRTSLIYRKRHELAEWSQDLLLLYPAECFERDRPHFLACADQIFQLEGLWEGMRQLLLAMRSLKSPCVASDLRYWEELGVAASHYPRQPEEPWRCIPAKLAASFHAFVAKEEANDSELKALRSKFAAFCLNGLRDNWSEKEREEAAASGRVRTNEDMVEASPDWRFCRVRAAKTLAINPEGRGHRLLQAASEMDPDPIVREAANDAYQSLRRGVTLPDGMSPRRAVLGAFWWLRQAHLKALDIEIDRDGAQRTRIKELSRTKERETN